MPEPTPSEIVRRLLPSRYWGNPEWAEIDKALADAGLVLVSISDLRAYTFRSVEMTEEERAAMKRLRAALPEDGDDA